MTRIPCGYCGGKGWVMRRHTDCTGRDDGIYMDTCLPCEGTGTAGNPRRTWFVFTMLAFLGLAIGAVVACRGWV